MVTKKPKVPKTHQASKCLDKECACVCVCACEYVQSV